MKTILSMGAGINSTALLLKWNDPLDTVLFADTGSERSETYAYIEKYLKPYCRLRAVPFVTIRRETKSKWGETWPLAEYYERRGQVPFRFKRETTKMWKLRPIAKWVRENVGEAEMLIAIDKDEPERVRDSGYPYIKNRYPLVEWGMSRVDCENAIRAAGWPVPIKSGCWCCPFQSLASWERLRLSHPDLFERACAMESTAQAKRPAAQFHPSGPLVKLKSRFANRSLDDYFTLEEERDFTKEECEPLGSCFL